jgi:hypothetical protein
VENQLGYKMVKWIERIRFLESEKLLGEGEGGGNEDHECFDLLPKAAPAQSECLIGGSTDKQSRLESERARHPADRCGAGEQTSLLDLAQRNSQNAIHTAAVHDCRHGEADMVQTAMTA